MRIKGVIVAAGYGSRFLPITKTVPKEMLPLLDRPSISFIVDEFIEAGIDEILIISSRRKKVLEDFFDREMELESVFRAEGKSDRLAQIKPPPAKFFFTRQQQMRGTGHALLCAQPFVGDCPFVVAYPDDLVFDKTSLARQLVEVYRQTGSSVLAAKDMGDVDVSRYGVLDVVDAASNPSPVRQLVEKPKPGREPSKWVSFGRFLLTPDIFPHLEEGWRRHLAQSPDAEFYHVDAINRLAAAGNLVSWSFAGLRLDTGQVEGYLESICRYALMRPELADFARNLFRKLSEPGVSQER
ncbi:UTP--glucose-1-phosphate uridylyltransferase [Sulfidibacter corallicola]|uniref:UTP--glucose-1-phosphate uridylyltransferase n=1 Tax=Sulfidibacter corallicola TaxID=2818388 RepID=A0A8A4TWX2_SULCO|nr:UTP--glucose-1-phosphate uridylyltransferase [Sulfidibacter corallicola]QTD53698.1 UTP--glucose-1-phosphate uridylyltransferase [Sulfidibacter corallicola]